MSRRSKREGSSKQPKPKPDWRVHPVPTKKGHRYKFVDKHHYPPKGDHACWLQSITRDEEFALFSEAERLNLSDEDANLYNIRKVGENYLEIGTRHELIAIFWNPHSASEWHGHPIWPIKTKHSLNRKNQDYRPSKSVMNRMIQESLLSERDSDRILNGDYP